MNKACTYIITNKAHTEFFVGSTNDLARKIFRYKKGLEQGIPNTHKFTKLVWYQSAQTLDQAIAEEQRIKSEPKNAKLNLIRQINPQWRDLYQDII